MDLEKAFDRVPRDVLWWALRRVGVQEWIINVIKSMYEGVTTSFRMVNGEESVKVISNDKMGACYMRWVLVTRDGCLLHETDASFNI